MKGNAMKLRTLTLYSALALSGTLLFNASAAEDKPAKAGGKSDKSKDAAGPNMEEMMKKWQEVATPGAAHKALEPMAGEWTVEARWWMGGPDAPPNDSKGTSKKDWILGGRFLHEEYKSEMMNMPFHGMGLTGYDNFKKK